MPSHAFRLFILISGCVSLAACGHEIDSSSTTVMTGHYAFQSQQGAEAVTMPGFVSRYQREVIVPGGPDGAMSPMAKNFDGIMDHLETLMMPQIEENNRIALLQSAKPAYRF